MRSELSGIRVELTSRGREIKVFGGTPGDKFPGEILLICGPGEVENNHSNPIAAPLFSLTKAPSSTTTLYVLFARRRFVGLNEYSLPSRDKLVGSNSSTALTRSEFR